LKIVDTIVDAIAKSIYNTGSEGRVIQTRNLSTALRWMAFGLLLLIILAILLVSYK
jgi:NADH-quinone oxidoreductase subunit L